MMRQLLLMVRNPVTTGEFFSKSFGLIVKHQSDALVELNLPIQGGSSIALLIREASSVAQLSVGYSPVISLEVKDMESAVSTALQLGAILDGPIKYPVHGKFAALRSPDGHIIGLFESAVP